MADIDAMLAELEGGPSYKAASDAENALRVLEQLDQLGDLRPGEKAELERLRAESGRNQEVMGGTEAAYRGALQGATFQQADEIYGLFGGDKEAARLKNKEAEAAFPSEYQTGKTAGAIGSGVASAVATGPLGAGRTLLGTMLRSGALGGAEGALWGAGGGEGIEDKLKQGAKYGAFGTVIGAAAPAAVAGGSALLRGAGDVIGGAAGLGNKSRANRAIMDTLRKAGMSVDDVSDDVARAASQGLPEYRTMDALGKAGQRRASGIVRAGGEGAEDIAQFLEQRQLGQPDRVVAAIDDAFGTRGTTAAKTTDMLKANRKKVADTMFARAADDAAPVDTREAIAMLDDTIDKMSNSGIKPPAVVKEFQKLRGQLAGMTKEGEPTTLSDYESVLGIWRQVRDDVDKFFKAGDGNIGEALKPVRDSLQRSLEDSSDLYRFATDNYREGSKVIDAVEAGRDMTRAGRPEDTIAAFNAMTDQQKKAARIGYGSQKIKDIVSNDATTANRAKKFNSPKAQAEARAMAVDPDTFTDRLARENTMWETQNRALQGSRTADNLADIEDIGIMADAGRAAKDTLTGNFGNAVSNVGGAIMRKGTGQNEATRAMMARILMSADPKKALSEALRNEARSQGRQRIATAVLRALGREHLTP